MSTQETLDEYRTVSFGRPEKDCPACGETIYSTELPEHHNRSVAIRYALREVYADA